MKDIYKSPMFYYVLVPVVLALWPLLVWGVYLPRASGTLNGELRDFDKGLALIDDILRIDPDRLKYADSKTAAVEFQYDREIHKVASSCGISPADYTFSSKPPRTRKGRKTQTCHVILKQVSIERFARFLSEIQLNWAALQCDTVTLTRKEGLPDAWRVDLDFKYTY